MSSMTRGEAAIEAVQSGISSGRCRVGGRRMICLSMLFRPVDALAGMRLSRLLVDAGLASSAGEARRRGQIVISQGAVQVDGERVSEDSAAGVSAGVVLREISGRRRYVRVV